ncbi:DNA primase, partial [Aeromonas schubertii]|nr:DNA primase [Aeromonas schubertii]
ADLAQLQARQQAQAEAQRRLEARLRQKAIQRAASIMADTLPGVSAYLEGKALSGVSVTLSQHVLVVGDLTFAPGTMVVPLYSEAGGELVNVQLIDGEGNK